MENPNCWNYTHQIINEAMQEDGHVSDNIVLALSKHQLLMEDTEIVRNLLRYVVEIEHKEYRKQMDDGECGYSFGWLLNLALLKLGVL